MTLKLLCAGKNNAPFQPVKLAFMDEDAITIRATSVALALFLARKNRPHIIICEQSLVDGTGFGLFLELNNEEELARIPFVFLLSDALEQTAILNSLKRENIDKDVHFFVLGNNAVQSNKFFSWKNEILKIIS